MYKYNIVVAMQITKNTYIYYDNYEISYGSVSAVITVTDSCSLLSRLVVTPPGF